MICELCGAQSLSGYKVRVEGTILNACAECAKGKSVVSDVRVKATVAPKKPATAPKPSFEVEEGLELVEGFGDLVRHARERMGLTQDELGKTVNEPHSVIHRIEMGKFEPSAGLARQLERRLKVRLMSAHSAAEDAKPKAEESKRMTLGDMIVVKKRGN